MKKYVIGGAIVVAILIAVFSFKGIRASHHQQLQRDFAQRIAGKLKQFSSSLQACESKIQQVEEEVYAMNGIDFTRKNVSYWKPVISCEERSKVIWLRVSFDKPSQRDLTYRLSPYDLENLPN